MAIEHMNYLWQLVEHWAAQKPESEALVFEEQRISWAQFAERIDRTAKALLELGVYRGDVVACIATGRPEFLYTYLAAHKIGAIWLGVSPKYSPDELAYVVGHCRPAVVVTLASDGGKDLLSHVLRFEYEFGSISEVLVLGETSDVALGFDEFVNRPRGELEEELEERIALLGANDEALLMYTSGSTGRPKGVLQTHRAILTSARTEAMHLDWTEDARTLMHLPTNHVAADVELAAAALYAGATMVLMDHFDPERALELIGRERITMLGQLPVMYLREMAAVDFAKADWSSVRTMVWGGSAAPPRMMEAFGPIAERHGIRMQTGYGSTELCGFVTYSGPDDGLDLLMHTVGRVAPPFEVKVVDEARRELPPGEVGEIAFRGPVVMRGYLNDPVGSREVLDAEGWYYTRDMGSLDANGYLRIAGRSSEMFKSGGENIFPREVEQVLESHPGVLYAAVIGVPDELYDEIGHAVVMPKPGRTLDPDELGKYCHAHLANFKVPKRFEMREEMPLLPNGKVDRRALLETCRPDEVSEGE